MVSLHVPTLANCSVITDNTNLLCITEWLTSRLTGLYMTKQINRLFIQHRQSTHLNQTNKTGGQLYSNTAPYEVSECSLNISTTAYRQVGMKDR